MRGQVLDVKGIELTAVDTTAPAITPDETTKNLANEAGRWVRGSWDVGFSADSDAGVCRTELLVNKVVVARGPTYTPKTGSWTQCGQGAGTLGGSGIDAVAHTLNTTSYANGSLAAEYYAMDAAQPANIRATNYHVHVDNSPVSLKLAGPSQALTTDGPQTIRATAVAGPSGLSGIWCSVDAGPWVEHTAAATANIEVSAPGINTVVCYARNNAVDATGATAQSPRQTWTVDIRKPSVSLISVQRVADALHCVHKIVSIHVPGHWTTEWYHGHRVRVRIPGQTQRVRVHRCHPRERTVVVHRDGQAIRERVPELPHRVDSTHARVRFGARATVSGWLGGTNGTGLGGQTVVIQVAPANGSQFSFLRTVRTSSDGAWTVHLPAGPSRLVEATYAGNKQLAPSTSRPVSITVRGSLRLRIRPRRTHWGSTIRISGRLRGGYIPSSGELVVLKIGWRGGSAEIGHVYTDSSGRFSAQYTFLRGTGSETYRIWARTIRESDYPYAPAASSRVRIRVNS